MPSLTPSGRADAGRRSGTARTMLEPVKRMPYTDAVIEAYKLGLDRTLLRENLRRTLRAQFGEAGKEVEL